MSYRRAFILLLLIQLVFFAPVFIQNKVIFPHNNDIELSGLPSRSDNYLSNRKFSDQSSAYIPEINQHLNGNAYHWLSTWNPCVQLGRPTHQLSGLSKVYLPTHLLSFLTQNPFKLYTFLTVLTVCLTGVFFFLFLKALQLSPIACLVSSLGLSLGIYTIYWLTFVMFVSTICWTVCLLWLVTEFIKKPSFSQGIGISFATYSLLLTGYPQAIILNGYVIVIQTLVNLCEFPKKSRQIPFRLLLILGSGLVGIAAAFPVYSDLLLNAQRSARLATSNEFFLAVLPKFYSIQDVFLYFAAIIDPFFLGNPGSSDYPITFFNNSSFYNGLSLSPFYVGLLVTSFSRKLWTRVWHWYGFILFCLLATLYPPIYVFAVNFLGFKLSRTLLLGGAVIPVFILCAYAIDYLKNDRFSTLYLTGSIGLLASIVTGLMLFSTANHPWSMHWKYLFLAYCLLGALVFFIHLKHESILIAITIISLMIYSHSTMLVRPLNTIQTTSPLVQAIQTSTAGNYRFALVGSDMAGILPANQEALIQLASIHSYDSLSSRNYQKLVASWSDGGSSTYGRLFSYLDNPEKITGSEFKKSGVNVFLSKQDLQGFGFLKTHEVNGIKFYKSLENPVLLLQSLSFLNVNDRSVALNVPLETTTALQPRLIQSFDDYQEIQVQPLPQKSLLFLSQQYHPQWSASSGGKGLETVLIEPFYQGVVIPPNTDRVFLEFKPQALWAWVPQLLYLIVGTGYAGVCWLKRIASSSCAP